MGLASDGLGGWDVLGAFGLTVAAVWPAKGPVALARGAASGFIRRALPSSPLDCYVCCAFWAALLACLIAWLSPTTWIVLRFAGACVALAWFVSPIRQALAENVSSTLRDFSEHRRGE